MLHKVFGRKLNRSSNERKRLFRNLARSLILHGKITTSIAKAKAIQPFVEKMITRAKVNTLHNRRILLKEITERAVVDKLLNEIGPAFKSRAGGYTRIIKTESRGGDNTVQAIISFISTVKETNAKDTPNQKK